MKMTFTLTAVVKRQRPRNRISRPVLVGMRSARFAYGCTKIHACMYVQKNFSLKSFVHL
jgi:hypothetical protein